MNAQEDGLFLTIDKEMPGNLSHCSLCNKEIKPHEDYFDYEYWGRGEIVHIKCMNIEEKDTE